MRFEEVVGGWRRLEKVGRGWNMLEKFLEEVRRGGSKVHRWGMVISRLHLNTSLTQKKVHLVLIPYA